MSQDNNWQQQVWQQPAPQQPIQQAAPYGYTQQPYAVQPTKKRGWIVALVAIVLLFMLIALSMWSCTMAMSSFNTTSLSNDADFLAGDAVGVINVDGTIQYDGTTCSPEGLKTQLDRAADNPHIKAIVLRVDSGGGTATAGEEMACYLREFSEATGKPIVVSSASINASAAYEISSQADYIYTAKTTAIGAIGTVMQVVDVSELMDKLGISVDNIASADSKDSSYGTRPLTEEERAYYQAQIDQINETFIQTVAEGRDMDVDAVRELATGMTFTGITAVDNGLADEVGTKEDAIDKAAELAGISGYTTVDLRQTQNASELLSMLDLFLGRQAAADDVAEMLKELENDGSIAQ